MIVKLHGDHRLTPRNLAAETEELNEAVAQRVATVLHDRGLVFIGYGGNDESIIRMLERLPDEALPFGVYWISDQEPRGIFRHWLEDRSAVWVQHRDFDELMLLVKFELELPDPTRERYDDVHARYGDRQMQLLESVAKKKDTPEAEALQSAAWWVYDAYVSGQASVDPPSAKERYLKGLELFPDSYKLRGNYAWFLENELKDFDGAQTEYEKAIKANPAAAPNLGNFANFLTKVRQNHDEAEEYYDKAVKADPKAASYLGNFAIFLTDVRQNPDKAEKYYRLAVEADSKDAKNLGNFANFLTTVRQNHDEAEKYYRLAIDADPKDANNIGNFSQYLLESGQSLEGLRYWREALALNDPEDAALTVELMFYGYAHGPASELSGYLSRLKKLLGKGARSKGWNFSRNVERATKIEKHPAKIWLAKLAAVCNGSAEITTLDKWKAWRDA
jgi:Tfp pilus assembly protein PilF